MLKTLRGADNDWFKKFYRQHVVTVTFLFF